MGYQYETSLPAYHEAKANIAETQKKVLEAIEYLCQTNKEKRCCDRDIKNHLRWEINRITARRNELVDMGKVVEVGKFFNQETKRKVIYWQPSKQTA